MSARTLSPRRQAVVTCAFVAVTVLACAGLISAATLVPAPPAVLPLILLACIGCPLWAAWELPAAVGLLRTMRRGALDPAELRRYLDHLPETDHPLGL